MNTEERGQVLADLDRVRGDIMATVILSLTAYGPTDPIDAATLARLRDRVALLGACLYETADRLDKASIAVMTDSLRAAAADMGGK